MRKLDDGHRNETLEQVLGYLNFSSGVADPKLLTNLNLLWAQPTEDGPTWKLVAEQLKARLAVVRGKPGAFEDAAQAAAVLELVFDHVIPGYRKFHAELLFHQRDEWLFNGLAVGRVCEAVLRCGGPWDEVERIVAETLADLNDFVGFRPVAVLESRKHEAYPHERIRPLPLYVRDVGVATGPYESVVTKALELLRQTDDPLLRAAYFDPDLLDELAVDPRAYDFDHPVNKRPNYHFGLWDPHLLDNQGRYRRFVVQQITLDALMCRLEATDDLPPEEIAFEAAAVLAGTILMASGISGSGPSSHDSTTTLATLLPRIAGYRDEFYERLIATAEPSHKARLENEAIERRQPFGAARQHLNAQLARRRAAQLEHVQLAKLFARMGYSDAAAEQANVVPAASARTLCAIDCRLTRVRQSLDARDPEAAADLLDDIVLRLRQGIECGAIVDPWSILGFDAQFSLFPALENSVHDHRVDELVELIEDIFGMYSRAWSEAAARDRPKLCERLKESFDALAKQWRQYAPHTVSNVDAVDPLDAFHAAEHVARALNLWHKGGAASGDIVFWAPHADIFGSPQAYALVIEALFDQADYVATMGLLMHWLCESDRVQLEQGESSFHRLAERWIVEVCRIHASTEAEHQAPKNRVGISQDQWGQIRKFFDFMEANADDHWQVPDFELRTTPAADAQTPDSLGQLIQDEDDEDGIYEAAYEGMVFRDSADDGIEGEMVEEGPADADEISLEAERLLERLAFLNTRARLWRITALAPLIGDGHGSAEESATQERAAAMRRWAEQAGDCRKQLLRLLEAVQGYRVPAPLSDHDSMVEYDRRRVLKESLLERIIGTAVETEAAAQLLAAVSSAESAPTAEPFFPTGSESSQEERLVVESFSAMFRNDTKTVAAKIDELIDILADLPLLYVPLAKGGVPLDIVAVRARQRWLQDLLKCLPRLGFFVATCRLIETARDMERNNPVGPGAVTEFDELYKIGFKALVNALVSSAKDWPSEAAGEGPENLHSPLVARLEQLTEAMLVSWLAHSRTLRLSVLEKANDKRSWTSLKAFVEQYGEDLFNQRFLNIANIRAILHQGVDQWLERMEAYDHGELQLRLLEDLDQKISRKEAVDSLTLVLEAIVENYGEYRDYNSTTTQSDRGDMLYTLLDFLRLRAKYDRVCWNLKPVVMAHEILVRRREKRAAQTWRRALRDRIGEEADKFQDKLSKLQKQYAMQMPSIADRIAERFVRPMVIDRICSLVQPAVDEASRPGSHPTFRILQYEIEFLTREPSGVGFDVPAWLIGLEDEIQRVRTPLHERDDYDELSFAVPPIQLTEEAIEEQLNAWSES